MSNGQFYAQMPENLFLINTNNINKQHVQYPFYVIVAR